MTSNDVFINLVDSMRKQEQDEINSRNSKFIEAIEKAVMDFSDQPLELVRALINVSARVFQNELQWSILGSENQVDRSWEPVKDAMRMEWEALCNRMKDDTATIFERLKSHCDYCISEANDEDAREKWNIFTSKIFKT